MEPIWISIFLVLFLTGAANGAVFTLQNRCKQTIWPGILSGGGKPVLMDGGLVLQPNQNATVYSPAGWSGRFWPRTGCSFDSSGGHGNCTTGDCGGVMKCHGAGGAPPASLAEFTLDSPDDFYDVSLVDGFNVPVTVAPVGGTGTCSKVDCTADVNRECPAELRVAGRDGGTVACKSPCMAFGTPEYCCTGEYGTPEACRPTRFSEVFKKLCPAAYSYAYDDATSTFTCRRADYLIVFC